MFAQADAPRPDTNPPNDQMATALHDLQQQVQDLRAAVAEIHSEAAQYRAEAEALRQELQTLRDHTQNVPIQDSSVSANAGTDAAQIGTIEQRVASLEESTQLLRGKVDDQYQTKVESASKYRVRLSGIVLLNLFSNRGAVDNQDFPTYAANPTAFDSNGTLGATVRQSELGLEVFGPTVAGAKSSGHFQFDFAGGFPNTLNGANNGLFRMRTGNVRLDWENTSVVAGQDTLFLSPQSPTSFASLAEPAFSYAGNLWGWIPQVRVEHRFNITDGQSVTISGGVLDNVDGEPPYSGYNRNPQAGERTGQPAYGSRLAWSHTLNGQPLTFGAAGFYSRQDWGFNRHVDGWAGMADWEIPLLARVALSGEFYRGRAIGGLGGGVGRSVLFSGTLTDPSTRVRALNSLGGWSQLKLKATSKLEFNGGFGLDNPRSSDLRWFPNSVSYYNPTLGQNRGALVNFIYRPRSNLLLSSEYRHLRTFETDGSSYTAEQVNMMIGVLF
jgi:regulator of replication initiation timing